MMQLAQMAVFSVDPRLSADRHNHIEITPHFQPKETCRRHSHHFHGMPVQGNLLANSVRVATELSLPERMADHRARRPTTGAVVLRSEHSAHQRLHAQRLEVVAAYPQALRETDIAALSQIELLVTPRKDARESLLMFSNLLPLRIGEVRKAVRKIARTAMLILSDLQLGQLFRMRYRQ